MPGSPARSTSERRPSSRALPLLDQAFELDAAADERESGARLQAAGERDAPRRRGAGVLPRPPLDPERDDRLGQALQLERADRRELVRRPRSRDEAHDLRAQDLAAGGLRADAGPPRRPGVP